MKFILSLLTAALALSDEALGRSTMHSATCTVSGGESARVGNTTFRQKKSSKGKLSTTMMKSRWAYMGDTMSY